MAIEVVAPAKLNLTLEVLDRRSDGYHEIVSVMQTIDLVDRIRFEPSSSLDLVIDGERQLGVPREGPRNLAYRAAQVLQEEAGRYGLNARIVLDKAIPAGMGLGGGSSDAAAVLRGLNVFWQLDLDDEALASAAAKIGSDVTFFLLGGTALVTGRGEEVEALPDLRDRLDFTLFISDLALEDKTKRAYGLLRPEEFRDGTRTYVTVESIRKGEPVSELELFNTFDRHVFSLDGTMGRAMNLCREAGVKVFAAGSGPAFFAARPLESLPEALIHQLDAEMSVHPLSCRSLSRNAALALRED